MTKNSTIDKEIIICYNYYNEITLSKILLDKINIENHDKITLAYEEYKKKLWLYTNGNIEGFFLKLKTPLGDFIKLVELNQLGNNYIEIYKSIPSSKNVYNFTVLESKIKKDIERYMINNK